jgi:restriction system protein
MTLSDLQAIEEDLIQLEQAAALHPVDAELLILGVLTQLLQEEGYSVQSTARVRDAGLDFVGTKSARDGLAKVSIALQYKHRRSPVDVSQISRAIVSAINGEFDRLLLITNSRFTPQAAKLAARELPIGLELLDIPSLRAWGSRLVQVSAQPSKVVQVVADLSRKLAHSIAEDPKSLWEIEWRDLERVLAEVFSAIGFVVTLTPGSKDKGKDLILECRIRGDEHSYIVEVKHWRSGKKVSKRYVSDFVKVVAREEHQGGMFVSSSGYASDIESLTEVERQHVKLGSEEKIISMCTTYSKRHSGLWSPPQALPEVLFANTI